MSGVSHRTTCGEETPRAIHTSRTTGARRSALGKRFVDPGFALVSPRLRVADSLVVAKEESALMRDQRSNDNNRSAPMSRRGFMRRACYAAVRGGLTIPTSQLAAVTTLNNSGHTYGFHPAWPELASLFNAGKLAVLFNVGTLVVPTTRTQFFAHTVPLPPQLFSHNDQQVQWQTSIPDQTSRTGWAGRCADLLASLNGNSSVSM